MRRTLAIMALCAGLFLLVPAQAQEESEAAATFRKRGIERLEAGDYEGAIQDFNQALLLFPRNAVVYFKRGQARQYLRDLPGAIADYSEAVDLIPGYHQAYNNRGVAYTATGEHDKAVADFTEAVRIRPDYAEAFYNRACTFGLLGERGEAIADCTEAIRLEKDYPDAFQARGRFRFQEGDLEGARGDFAQVILLRPAVALPYLLRGMCRERLGDLAGAVEDYSESLNVGVSGERASGKKLHAGLRARALSGRGRCAVLLGDREAGLADLSASGEQDPSYAYAPVWLAALGKPDPAALERAAESEHWVANAARFFLGRLDAEGLLASAAEVREDAKQPAERKKEHTCEARCYLGMQAELDGDLEAAKAHYQACVDTGVARFGEHRWALVRLEQLGVEKAPPK